MKHRLKIILMAAALVVIAVSVHIGAQCDRGCRDADVTVRSEKSFNRLASKHRFVVVLLYYQDKDMRKKGTVAHKIDELKRMFRAVSREERYRDAGVVFVFANAATRDNVDIAETFGVPQADFPVIILVRNGDAVRMADGSEPLKLIGYSDRKQLVAFIDAAWKDKLLDEAERREEEAKRRRESRGYWYYGPYYGYPGWGYPGWGWYGGRAWW